MVTTQPSDPAQSGIPFPQQPVVQIQDAAGNPAPITKTIFATLRSGGGTLSGTTSLSTGGGSSVTFTNLAISGLAGPRTLLFSASGLASDSSATFSLIAGKAAQIAADSPVTQSAPVGTPVASPPSVVVKDGAGNPVAGVTVTFAVTQGAGSLNGPTQVTDASGVATVSDWTLGPLAGVNTVTATATGQRHLRQSRELHRHRDRRRAYPAFRHHPTLDHCAEWIGVRGAAGDSAARREWQRGEPSRTSR